jgi:hypothetical protein
MLILSTIKGFEGEMLQDGGKEAVTNRKKEGGSAGGWRIEMVIRLFRSTASSSSKSTAVQDKNSHIPIPSLPPYPQLTDP